MGLGVSLTIFPSLLIAQINPEIIATIESSNNPKAFNAMSGARGLMQITPICLKHYNQVHKTSHSVEELFDAEFNKRVGTWYLKWLASKCDSDREVLISYNRGFKYRKDSWQPSETTQYLAKYQRLLKSYS